MFNGFQKGYEPKYWNDKGKFQKELDVLTKELVPFEGKASTKEGELVRAINNFYYERFNNGHCNSKSYESGLISRFLSRHADAPAKSLTLSTNDETLDLIVDFVVGKILADRQPTVEVVIDADAKKNSLRKALYALAFAMDSDEYAKVVLERELKTLEAK